MRERAARGTLISRLSIVVLGLAVAALALPSAAAAHPRVSPAVSVAGELQLYSLAVPTEKGGLTTTKVVMTLPPGFTIDSFAPPPPGWHQRLQRTGAENGVVVTRVTWAGGHTPTGEVSLFQFLGRPASAGEYRFEVRQTYSDGSIVEWSGADISDAPAPSIEVKGSLSGGGVSVLTIVALVLGALGLVTGGVALFAAGASGARPLA